MNVFRRTHNTLNSIPLLQTCTHAYTTHTHTNTHTNAHLHAIVLIAHMKYNMNFSGNLTKFQ